MGNTMERRMDRMMERVMEMVRVEKIEMAREDRER